MPLTRNPPVWKEQDKVSIVVKTEPLSDGTLVVFVQVKKDWLHSNWKEEIHRFFSLLLKHVKDNAIGFAMFIHVCPGSDLTVEIVRFVNEYLKKRRKTLIDHLKGTAVIIPSATVELIVMTALAILPPLKPFETSVWTPDTSSSSTSSTEPLTEWGLPKYLQKKVLKSLVALPWPDE